MTADLEQAAGVGIANFFQDKKILKLQDIFQD